MGVVLQFALGELPSVMPAAAHRLAAVMFGFMLNVIYGPNNAITG